MNNHLKNLVILLALVASCFVGVKGAAAATGTTTVSMAMGTVSINVAKGSTLSVSATPVVLNWGTSTSGAYSAAQTTWPDQPLDVYTVACWLVAANGSYLLAGEAPIEKCGGPYDSGPATSYTNTLAQTATGTTALGTGGLQMCSWLSPYNATDNRCDTSNMTPGAPLEPGIESPTITGNLLSNLDAFVGQVVTFDVWTNWCSYIAPHILPPGYVADPAGVVGDDSLYSLGCANAQSPIITLAANSSTRMLAASGKPLSTKVKLAVKASSFDCHVSRVKGLTLRKATLLLHKNNCRSTVHYINGRDAGRVRYQSPKAGIGRPRGYRIKLAVVRGR